jgi:hypothetical protein
VHAWLAGLKNVCGSKTKETFFFMDSGHPMANPKCNFHQHGLDAYRQLFPADPTGKTLDATTHYFYQQTAMDHFARSGTKACVILRHPSKRLVSYFEYVCFTRCAARGPINFGEFVEGLLAGDVNRFRPAFVDEREFHVLATSLSQGEYVVYLEKWLARLGPSNFRVFLFEDLVADQETQLRELAEFFGVIVDDSQALALPRVNETLGLKYPGLDRWARPASRLLTHAKTRRSVRELYLRFQQGKKPDMASQFPNQMEKLNEYYRPFNQQLRVRLNTTSMPWT